MTDASAMPDTTDPHDLLVSARMRRLEGGLAPHLDAGLTRVRRGYFRASAVELNVAEQHRLRVLATADARNDGLVFSHASAAVLWGCPQLGTDLTHVHATRPGAARRRTAGVVSHRSTIPDGHVATSPDGLLITSRAWTAVQLATTGRLPNALLPLDHLVRLLVEERTDDAETVIESLVDLVPPRSKGRARAVHLLRLADPRSGSAAESLSRGQMVLLGIPKPELQVRFPRMDEPGDDIVDFDWPELDAYGECDGEAKYFDADMTGGRAPRDVLWAEKVREDRVRRHRRHGARWGWNDALSRSRLGRILERAGITPTRTASP